MVAEKFPEAVPQEIPRPEETRETVVRESFVHEKPDITETVSKEITISPKPTTEEVVLGFEGPTDVSSQDETVEVLEEEHFKEEITVSPEKPEDVDETVFEVQIPKEDVPEEEEDFEVATHEHFKEEITLSPEKPTDVGEVVLEVQMPKEDVPTEGEYLEVVEQEHFKEEITVSSEKPTDIDGVIAEVRVPEDVPEYKVATEEEQPKVFEKETFQRRDHHFVRDAHRCGQSCP